MPIPIAAFTAAAQIGLRLFEFIEKISQGEKGDSLGAILGQIDAIRESVNKMGEELLMALQNAQDVIIGDNRLEQLAKLPEAHTAITAYLSTHPDLPNEPQRDDENYIEARGRTSDVVTYFLGHSEMAFMGGFVHAMSTRVEFMTALDKCPFQHNPEYVVEIRNGVNHLNDYISRINADLDKQILVHETQNTHFEVPEGGGRPRKVVDSTTVRVIGFNVVFFEQTAPAEADGELAATRVQARHARAQASTQTQTDVTGNYQQIAATWNTLVADQAAMSIQNALLPDAGANRVRITSIPFEVTGLPGITPIPGVHSSGNNSGPSPQLRYALPLRNILVDVLDSPDFHDRQQRSLGGASGHLVSFWVRKAFHRVPTASEAATLADVMRVFGPTSFFHCLAYSTEYTERWGDGLPYGDDTLTLPTRGSKETYSSG
jgi:hypothetical protein